MTINTITPTSVLHNTWKPLEDYIDRADLQIITDRILALDGVVGLKTFEDNVTIMAETGNVEALCDFAEEIEEKYMPVSLEGEWYDNIEAE